MKTCAICGKKHNDEPYRSPYFCRECDIKRIEKITRQFQDIAKSFGIETEADHAK